MRRSANDSPSREKSLGRKDPCTGARKNARANLRGRLLRLEALEERTLLTASSDIGLPDDIALPDDYGLTPEAVVSPNSSGFSPQEFAAAYSNNNIYFGSTAGNGAGVTIAIVDAFNDTNIAGDLTAFDTQFGLPAPPSFTVVNQTGGTTNLPLTGTDSWAREESLDVEWAHATAPGANIVVVEANANDRTDLYTAITEAATLASVVSMSFGSTEFSGELAMDADFTAPGVTFAAGAGDAGAASHYPADSPNVLSVGGTSLYVNSNNGAPPYSYNSETAWANSGGGPSSYEPEPSYQDGVQSSGVREIPDVASDADPATGLWVYDSLASTSGANWYKIGGNSAGGPTWSGRIAIADQGRLAAGLTTLSGSTQTLPALYNLGATSPQDFHDVTTGGNGTYNAGPGYDEVTGLGSPVTNLLVPGLVGGGTAAAATELTVVGQPPANVSTGSPFSLTVVAEDAAGTMDPNYNGPVTVSLASNPGGGTLGGTLTATAVAGVATFNNLSIDQPGNGYTLQAAAGGLATATTNSLNVLAAPVVNPSGTTNLFRLGGAAAAVDSALMVSSIDATLAGATVTINNYQAGDALNFTNQNGITGSYSAGLLTLSGTATVAQYQAALQSVTFTTTSTITTTRSLSIVAQDGSPDDLDSGAAAEDINVTVAAPIVTSSGTTGVYNFGGSPVPVDSGLTVTSGDTDLTGGTVTINNWIFGDTLNFTNQSGITATYLDGVLDLFGTATVAQYQAALQSITFSSTSNFAMTRSISIVAIDGTAQYGTLDSAPAAEQIYTGIAPPVVTASGFFNIFTVTGTPVPVDSGITVTSSDTDLTGASLTITNDQPGDTLNFTNSGSITGSYNSGTGVLTLSGSATVAQYQAALRSVTFSTTSTNTTLRTVDVVGDDSLATPTAGNPAMEYVGVTVLNGNLPVVTPSGQTNTFTFGGSPVAVDSGVKLYDANPTGATVTINNLQSGDTLNFTNQNGISGVYSAGVLTLTGSATTAQYQTALQSVTFSTTTNIKTTRSLSIVAFAGALASNPASESVLVSFPPPVVTASGSTASYTAGAATVVVDSGVTASSQDADITGATVKISLATFQSGDTLSFTSPVGSGISGSYSSGVLTLSGSATPAQYQAALESVAFSSTSTSTTTRSISIVARDGSLSSNSASEQVSVFAPAKVIGVYVAGSAWTSGFDVYLLGHGLGNTSPFAYILQTGANQLTTLPWSNINTIDVQFSENVNVVQSSLQISGGSGGSTPSVTGFKSDGNHIYTWTLSGSLTDNRYLISLASTTSSFGTPVTDSQGAGLSGAWTTGSSNFTTGSGNGLAGGTFNFYFNVLPGDANQNGIVNSIDAALARSLVNDHTNTTGYNPYVDYSGAGLINTIDSALDGQNANDRLPTGSPTAPSALEVAGPGFTPLALGVQESSSSNSLTTGSSSSNTPSTASNQTSSANTTLSSPPAAATSSTAIAGSNSTAAANMDSRYAAIDVALSEFDLADVWA